jgi:hypothetical protein
MVAALQAAREPLSRLDELAQNIDYSKFRRPDPANAETIVGPALSLVTNDGLYQATTWSICWLGCWVILAWEHSVICAPD